MLTITGKGINQRRRLFEDFSVPPPGEVGDGLPRAFKEKPVEVASAIATGLRSAAKCDQPRA